MQEPNLESEKCIWNYFAYPIQARAEFELVRKIDAGKLEGINPYFGDTSSHISLPSEEISKMIYVPEDMVQLDNAAKRKNPRAGFQLFGEDEINSFLDDDSPYPFYNHRRLFDHVHYGIDSDEPLDYDVVKRISGKDKLAKLMVDPQYREISLKYTQAFLKNVKISNDGAIDICTRLGDENLEEIGRLVKIVDELIGLYSSEMNL
jgi:hypothetical protein